MFCVFVFTASNNHHMLKIIFEGGEYGSADLVTILGRTLDSQRNFNGSADPMITVDRGFIQLLCPDY